MFIGRSRGDQVYQSERRRVAGRVESNFSSVQVELPSGADRRTAQQGLGARLAVGHRLEVDGAGGTASGPTVHAGELVELEVDGVSAAATHDFASSTHRSITDAACVTYCEEEAKAVPTPATMKKNSS
jgi:hypothetical protein